MFCASSIVLNAQTGKLFFTPEIKYDIATLSGIIDGMIPDDSVFKPINLSFTNVVTEERMSYDVPVKKDGTFSLSVPIQCTCICPISSDYFNGSICLTPGEETILEISYDSNRNKHVKLINNLGFTADDALNIQDVVDEAVTQSSIHDTRDNDIVSPEIFSQHVINRLTKCIKLIDNTDKLSGVAKQIATSEVKVWFITTFLFDYAKWMNLVYLSQSKADSVQKEFHPQVPGKLYYSSLKSLKLYDTANFCASFYSNFLQLLLINDTLAIPAIGNMPINKWLSIVKDILKEDLGCDKGLFYDLLACHAYVKQLNYLNTLSEIQKNNIRSYFTNKSFVNILFDENEKVILAADKKNKINIYEISESSNHLMDSIVAKYKGKVVFVDFWATWCGWCLKAMNESEIVRKELEYKDVVFVYVTDHSSPRELWEQKIYKLGGEQYYLSNKEMGNLYQTYDFTGLPHYLIFDKNGVLKYNKTSFMGNENMRKWIEELL